MEFPYINGDSLSPSSSLLSSATPTPDRLSKERLKYLHRPLSPSALKDSLVNNVKSVSSATSESTSMDSVKFERIHVNWLDLVFPLTILTITFFGIAFIAIILFIWMKNNLLNSSEQSHMKKIDDKLTTVASDKKIVKRGSEITSIMSRSDTPSPIFVDKDWDKERPPPTPPKLPTPLSSPLLFINSPIPTPPDYSQSILSHSPVLVPVSIPVPSTFSIYSDANGCKKLSKIHCGNMDDKENDNPSHEGCGGNVNPLSSSPSSLSSSNNYSYFNFSPKLTAIKSQSPLVNSASYKLGNYFHFPDVDIFSPSDNKPTDKKPDKIVETPPSAHEYENTLPAISSTATRRARLKSISLDSESARMVEDNLAIPLDEIIDLTNENFDMNTNKAYRCKNKNNLTIDLKERDDITCVIDDRKIQSITTPKTPTLTQTRQKALSLDSDNTTTQCCSVPVLHISSISVPTTPKKQQNSCQNVQHNQQDNNSCNSSNQSLPTVSKHSKTAQNFQYKKVYVGNKFFHHDQSRAKMTHIFTKKLGSFDENTMDSNTSTNLQVLKTNTLSLSNNNLKTLPEVMTLSDFSTTQGHECHEVKVLPVVTSKANRSTILQRRGSNHSLTLNLDGSGSVCNLTTNLSKSNYSLGNSHQNLTDFNSSHLTMMISSNSTVVGGINTSSFHKKSMDLKKNLLQRRGSNTSLTLNIQNSNSSLNRFNSHSSLNIATSNHEKSVAAASHRKSSGLLERRNSNASLTLNIHNRGLSISNVSLRGSACSLNSINVNHNEITLEQLNINDNIHEPTSSSQSTQQRQNYRKFLSSENLSNHQSTPSHQHTHYQSTYGSIDDLKTTTSQFEEGDLHSPHNQCTRNITTKPLSPQSTSEDFKIYLANIQFLQNASNVLNSNALRNLNYVFQNTCTPKTKNDAADVKHDVIVDADIPDEDNQKRLLRNLHQEFWDLPTNYQEKPMVFGSQTKNRYKTILPNEHSRVILTAEEDLLQEPYINANYIKGPDYTTNSYIATQGPMPNTVYEFWLMVQQNVDKYKESGGYQKIAMLTNFIENGRQKCAVYFPKNSNEFLLCKNNNFTNLNNCGSSKQNNQHSESYLNMIGVCDEDHTNLDLKSIASQYNINENFFLIQNVSMVEKIGYTIRKFYVVYYEMARAECNNTSDGESAKMKSFYVHHYWFPDWPDHRSPENIDVLLDLSLDILDDEFDTDDDDDREERDGSDILIPLPIIHCSAGIGRTGCLAAILNGLRQMRISAANETNTQLLSTCEDGNLEEGDSKIDDTGMNVDVLGIVCNLRLQRGGMVQNSEQYELVHRALCLYQERQLKH